MVGSVAYIMVFFLSFYSTFGWTLSDIEAEKIGQKIYANECGCQRDKLVWWHPNEEFPSLGIGHFIWHPKGSTPLFEETFPTLLIFLKEEGVVFPTWLRENFSCPWHSRAEFMSKEEEAKRKELQEMLAQTIPLQARFIVYRFQKTQERLLAVCDVEKKKKIEKILTELMQTTEGSYCLLDYLNFKGEGISSSEQYKGQGWGLLQVLEEIPPNSSDLIHAFTDGAKRILQRRVHNAPVERHEERWLPGWIKRIDSYLKS